MATKATPIYKPGDLVWVCGFDNRIPGVVAEGNTKTHVAVQPQIVRTQPARPWLVLLAQVQPRTEEP